MSIASLPAVAIFSTSAIASAFSSSVKSVRLLIVSILAAAAASIAFLAFSGVVGIPTISAMAFIPCVLAVSTAELSSELSILDLANSAAFWMASLAASFSLSVNNLLLSISSVCAFASASISARAASLEVGVAVTFSIS